MRWICVLALVPTAAWADVSLEGEVGVFSTYVWRGFEVAGAPSLQPSVTAGYADLSLNMWGAFALSEREDHDVADELDVTVAFAPTFGPVATTVGYLQYTFPNGADEATHSEEVFAGVGLDVPLSPTLTGWYDFGLLDAAYVQLAVSHDFTLPGRFVLAPTAWTAVSNTDALGFHDATLAAELRYGSGPVQVAARGGYSYAAAVVNPDRHGAWAGLVVAAAM